VKFLLAAIAVFFAAPATAVAAPSVVARDLSVRSGLVAQAPNAFDLVGLHWKGSLRVADVEQDDTTARSGPWDLRLFYAPTRRRLCGVYGSAGSFGVSSCPTESTPVMAEEEGACLLHVFG